MKPKIWVNPIFFLAVVIAIVMAMLCGCSRVKITMASGAEATSTSVFWDKSFGYMHYTYDPNGCEEILVESLESKVVDVLREVIR